MGRAPFQVIVIPFRQGAGDTYEFAALRRSDKGYWQSVSGGGEDDESPEEAAVRELREEAGVHGRPLIRLASMCTVPAWHFAPRSAWPPDLYVLPEYAFAVDVTGIELTVSDEHVAAAWGSYAEIAAMLHWDSNRTALWELNQRLTDDRPIRFRVDS